MNCRHGFIHLAVLLATALVLPIDASGQTGAVEGVVRDAAGQPLPGVNVVALPADADAADMPLRGAATENDGRYFIGSLPSGAYRIRATAVGFREAVELVEVSPGQTATVDLVLHEITLESGQVVVTAARREQALTRAPASLSVIGAQELEVRNVVSLDEALRYVPGVQLAEEEISIRGSSGFSYNTGSRVLLLIDGIPFLSPERNGVPFEGLPMTQVEQIEVLKGSGSALYGSGAIGGVINVITRDFPEVPETTVRMFAGSYEPVRHVEWRNRWDDAGSLRPMGGTVVSHARRFSERFGGWVHLAWRGDTGYTNFGAEQIFDGYVKVGWRPEPTIRLDVLGGLTRRKADAFLYWNGLNDPLNPGELRFGQVTAIGTNDNLVYQFSVMPSFTHLAGSDWSYSLKARLFGASIRPLEDDGTPKPMDQGTTGFRYGGEGQLTWDADAGFLTAGVTGDALLTESSFFRGGNSDDQTRSQPEGAVFAQWEQDVLGRLEITTGLRYDFYHIDQTRTESKLSPKISVAYSLTDATALRGAYGHGFRVPGLTERFVSNRDFLPIVPNLDLLPETSVSYEVGIRSGLSLGRSSISADVATFWNDYRRLIEAKFINVQEAFQFVNLTSARVRGVESVLQSSLLDERIYLQLAHTYLDADDLTEDEPRPLVYRSTHLVQSSITARPAAAFDVGIDYRFASKPERVDTDFAIFVRDAIHTVPIHVVDVRLGYTYGPFRFAILVDNLLDYYYVERPAILAPPRNYTLQLQATW